MVAYNPARVTLMLLGFLLFLAALTLKGLSGFGPSSGVFQQSSETVMLRFTTPFTPAPWALFVWDFSYIWMSAMFAYFIAGLCRRSAYDWLYTTPTVLPYGFHISLIGNVCLNITWLFLFDRELLLAALITSAFMTLSSYLVLFFSCRGLKIYGGWLSRHHPADLWLFRILVQNGMAASATWGTLSTFLNLTMYLQYRTDQSACDCATLPLQLLLMGLFAWFLLENLYLEEHVRYMVSIYPVVVVWLIGVLVDLSSADRDVYEFSALVLAVSCLLLVLNICLVTWRHRRRPLFTNIGPSMSPVELALNQRKIFL